MQPLKFAKGFRAFDQSLRAGDGAVTTKSALYLALPLPLSCDNGAPERSMVVGAVDELTRDAPRPRERETPAREWIIQRCLNAFRNEYEDWPGYCERLLTREEMLVCLCECETRWPDYELRGHNVVNQRPGR